MLSFNACVGFFRAIFSVYNLITFTPFLRIETSISKLKWMAKAHLSELVNKLIISDKSYS